MADGAMGIDKKILYKTIQDKIDKIEERYPGYRENIFEVVGSVYDLEVTHRRRQTNIDQRIFELIIKKAKVLENSSDN